MSYRDEFISKANNYLNQDVHMNCNRFYMGIQNNYPGRGKVYSDDANWCATFVCWIAGQVIPLSNRTQTAVETVIPFECGAYEMMNLYKATGASTLNGGVSRFKDKNSKYEPKPGDLFFSYNGSSYHVGFVHSGTAASFRTLEGNNGGMVKTVMRSINDGIVIGFGCNEICYAVHEGYLDGATSTCINGWAFNGLTNDRLKVHIHIFKGSESTPRIKQVVANIYRQDLDNAGKGNGYCAYEWNGNLAQYGSGRYTIRTYIITADQDNYAANKECQGSPKYVTV